MTRGRPATWPAATLASTSSAPSAWSGESVWPRIAKPSTESSITKRSTIVRAFQAAMTPKGMAMDSARQRVSRTTAAGSDQAAAQVVARLPGLSAAELDLVEEYERSHRRRRTVLGRIAQLKEAG